MTATSPTWLKASYVQKILGQTKEDETIKVSGITVKPATAPGDNYLSNMYRVYVEFSRVRDGHEIQEEVSIIAKAVPHGEPREKLIESMGVFEKEMSMMSVTLPRINGILEEVCQPSLGAQCFYIQSEKPVHMIFEDLVVRGFRMVRRQSGLDLDHSLLAIQNLSRFHAASVALKEKDATSFAKYNKAFQHIDNLATMGRIFTSGVRSLVNAATEWPELNPRIIEKLRKLSSVIFKKACEASLYRKDDFNVLNHGDYWINNMMFRYDDQHKLIDHIFVDFQSSHYGSPACDLLYFLGSSVNNDVRSHHRDLLLQEYHTSLTNIMAQLKCITEAPSFEQLEETLKNRAFCEVCATITILPRVLLEENVVIDLQRFLDPSAEYINPAHNGKTYRKIMTRFLPLYDSMGLLDV